jgi:type II secretory pathway pseudopilin PulG
MVVLVILAIVATVAVQSLQPQVDQQRFESASRLLAEIKSATVGPTQKYQLDGTPLISGFVADVGRCPRMENSPSNVDLSQIQPEILNELWDAESELGRKYPFQFRPGPNQPVDYSSIRLPCGWRGPYLALPAGADSLKDPWGRPPEAALDADGEFCQLQITIPLDSNQTEPQTISTELTTGRVEVTGKLLLDNPENTTTQVALLVPDPETSLTTLAVLDDEDQQPGSFRFANVPIGLRAIVADVNGQRKTKYVQVTHEGIVVVFDFQTKTLDEL